MSKGKRNKFGAIRTNGFDSRKEERRYRELLMLQASGEIEQLECQVRYILSEQPRVSAVIDFRYAVMGAGPLLGKVHHWELEDVKGIDRKTGKPVTLTAAARAKYAWLKEKYGLEVRIV